MTYADPLFNTVFHSQLTLSTPTVQRGNLPLDDDDDDDDDDEM